MLPFMTTNNYAIEQAAAQFDSDTLPSELTNPTAPPPTGEAHHRSVSDHTFHQHDDSTPSHVHHHDRNDTVTQQSASDIERTKCRRHHHRSIDFGQCKHAPAPVAREVHEEDGRKPHTMDAIAEAKGRVMDRFRATMNFGKSEHTAEDPPFTQEAKGKGLTSNFRSEGD